MQSPNPDQLRTPDPKRCAVGCLVVVGAVLSLPLIAAVFFKFVGMAAWAWHGMAAAVTGVL